MTTEAQGKLGSAVARNLKKSLSSERAARESIRYRKGTPFEQGSLARRYGGLGLGLAISRSLVQMHGGRITVISDGLDQGATFTVELPIASDFQASDEMTAMENDFRGS